MQKFDFKFINSEFGNSEIGYANIFYKYYTGKIYVLNLKTKFGYLWNEKTKLYEELTDTILIPQISKLLQTMMDTMIQATKDNDLLDETEREKKIKSQLERKSKFGTSSTTTNIYKFLLSKYVDESKIKLSFEAGINSESPSNVSSEKSAYFLLVASSMCSFSFSGGIKYTVNPS